MIVLEIDLGGVFIPAALVWGGAAFVVSSFITWLLSQLSLYRRIWHRGLFDIAVFVLVWGGICYVAYSRAFSLEVPASALPR